MWRVERAAPLSVRAGHEGLEGFAEHLWVDGRLDPIRALFTRRESVAREHLAEEFAHLLIRKEHAAERALVRRAREEAAVQERDAAEGTCRRGASRITGVESAQKKAGAARAGESVRRSPCTSRRRERGIRDPSPAIPWPRESKERANGRHRAARARVARPRRHGRAS